MTSLRKTVCFFPIHFLPSDIILVTSHDSDYDFVIVGQEAEL